MLKRIILSASIFVLLAVITIKFYEYRKEADILEDKQKIELLTTENIYLSESIEVANNDNSVHEITDEQFVGFINDLYEYPRDYENQQFRIRGHYRTRIINGEIKHYIYQGKDERWIGVPISDIVELPAEGSTIQVVGTITIIRSDSKEVPYLELSSVIIINEKQSTKGY